MTDGEREEELVLARLEAIRDLRKEMHRLKSEGDAALASGVAIPAGWLDLLRRGLAIWIEDLTEKREAAEKLSDDERREHIERARRLVQAIGDVEPGSACSVAPSYHETLRFGLGLALLLQSFERERLTKYDPLGLRFIAERSETVLGRFIWAFGGLLHPSGERAAITPSAPPDAGGPS